MAESKDTLSGSNLEHMSSRRLELMNRDWRHFFEETELDNAFQRVEIEQKDISEEGTDAGSTSNPSEDNLDEDELAANIYNLEDEKFKIQKALKMENEQKLIAQVKDPMMVNGQQMYNKLAGKGKEENNNNKEQNAGRNI